MPTRDVVIVGGGHNGPTCAGGGVMGVAGRNAATAILKDVGREGIVGRFSPKRRRTRSTRPV